MLVRKQILCPLSSFKILEASTNGLLPYGETAKEGVVVGYRAVIEWRHWILG
jgi:hypothetical protein